MKPLSRFALLSALALSLASCGASWQNTASKDGVASYAGTETHFQSSDEKLDTFLNEYLTRYLGYDDTVGDVLSGVISEIGNGSTFEKMWETQGLSWLNNASEVYKDNKAALMESYFRTITQDSYGLIYNSNQSFVGGSGSAVGDGIPEGWPFPTAANSYGQSENFEFNSDQEIPASWKSSAGDSLKSENGFAVFSFQGAVNQEFSYGGGSTLQGGIVASQAPMVEIDLRVNDLKGFGASTAIDDVAFRWQCVEDGDVWHEVRQRSFAADPLTADTAYFANRMYLPMYLSKDWDGKHISAVQVAVLPKANRSLDITGKLNYIRCGYDTRKSTHTSIYLIGLGQYLGVTGNVSLLKDTLLKARKAMAFLLGTLQGEKGLLDLSYFYAHDGARGVGRGLPDGYWDILLSPSKNLESNLYFYEALREMAQIEAWAQEAGITLSEAATVKAADPSQTYTYAQTSDSLAVLASTVKANLEKTVAEGGFYNPATGRFASGVNAEGTLLDYGYVMWNLETLAAGVGTAEERASVMAWISGKRVVVDDDSQGDDIYLYEFSPRITTKKNHKDYNWFWKRGEENFGVQIQDGGAAICWSYYDLLSRLKEYGSADAFERLQAISTWYYKVRSAGGYGADFYRDYYDNLEPTYDKNGNEISYTLQGGPSNGSLGLDDEFFESIMLTAAIPFGFFGMSSGALGETAFAYALPASLDYWQIDNLQSQGVTYSLKMANNAFVVAAAHGELSADKKFTFAFAKPAGAFQIRIDGVPSSDYVVDGDQVKVSVPMGNVKVALED